MILSRASDPTWVKWGPLSQTQVLTEQRGLGAVTGFVEESRVEGNEDGLPDFRDDVAASLD